MADTLRRTWGGKFLDDGGGAFNVMHPRFTGGADIGDGVTDPIPAFADALAACPDGGTLIVPPPNVSYKMDEPWVIDKNRIMVEFQGDPAIDATGHGGSAIQVTGTGVTLNRPSLIGGGTAPNGIEIGGGTHRIVMPKITGFTNGILGDAIGVVIESPQITGNTNGIRVQRHSVVVRNGQVLQNTQHNIWFEGDGTRGFSNKHRVEGTLLDIPLNGYAIYGSGTSNYNCIIDPNIEGGANTGLRAAIKKPTAGSGRAWTFVAGHVGPSDSGIIPYIIDGRDESDFVFGGYWAGSPIGPETEGLDSLVGTTFAWEPDGAQGSQRQQINHFGLDVRTATQITTNTTAFSPTGSLCRISSDAVRRIRGITGNYAGRFMVLVNVGSFGIEFTHEDSGVASTSRRIATPMGSSMVLNPGESALLLFEGGTDRWRYCPLGGQFAPEKSADAAQLTANQNDYNPGIYFPNWRLTSDASRTITGLATSLIAFAPRRITILNTGSFNIVLANQSASSAAASRIITGTGADLTLTPDQSATLWYDGTTARWRVVGKNF